MPEANVTENQDRVVERRKSISEAFHSFHQPLTALHCGLELTLQRPRSEAEYRKRIEDALTNAGLILQLNKALRELVDATDPGERFGTVALAPLLAQLKDEISVLAEASQVEVAFTGPNDAYVAADPMKLLRTLGNLVSAAVEELNSGSHVELASDLHEDKITIRVTSKGTARPCDSQPEEKLRDIRFDAARSYCWTLGGSCDRTNDGLEITLPIQR